MAAVTLYYVYFQPASMRQFSTSIIQINGHGISLIALKTSSLVLAKGEGGGGRSGMDWESGASSAKYYIQNG